MECPKRDDLWGNGLKRAVAFGGMAQEGWHLRELPVRGVAFGGMA